MASRLPARLLLSLLAILLPLLLVEGAISLLFRRSLIHGGATAGPRMRLTDEERLRAAAATPGPYAADPDPFVALRVKGAVTRSFPAPDGAPATTDEWGMRVRPGPAAAASARRIALLGDSVVFGWGLLDHETMGARLEEILAGTAAGAEPRPEVRSVASPGWTFRNEYRYLLDHLHRLRPEIVILVPLGNDLNDSASVLETGHRTIDLDPGLGAAGPQISEEHYHALGDVLRRTFGEALNGGRAHGGNFALLTDVTPESRRRFDAMAAGIADLRSRLTADRRSLHVLLLMDTPFERRLAARLRRLAPDLPLIAGLARYGESDHLPGDPHPSARCARALAWRIARHLTEATGLLPGAIEPEDPVYRDNILRLPPPAEAEAYLAEASAADTAAIGPAIDLAAGGLGYHQIYGGADIDANVGLGVRLVLRSPGCMTLRLRIQRLPASSGIYPLSIAVEIAGIPVGAVDVPPAESGGVFEASLALPAATPEPFLEILLRPSNWIASSDGGRTRLTAFRLLAVEALR